MKRYAGPEFRTTVELIASSQHDRQKFYVDRLEDWRQTENGDLEIGAPTCGLARRRNDLGTSGDFA